MENGGTGEYGQSNYRGGGIIVPPQLGGPGEPYPPGSIVVVTVAHNTTPPWIYRVALRDKIPISPWHGPAHGYKLEPLAFIKRRILDVNEERREQQGDVYGEKYSTPRYELSLEQPLRVLEKANPLEISYSGRKGIWEITGGEQAGLYIHSKIEAHDVVHWQKRTKQWDTFPLYPPGDVLYKK